MQKRLVAGLSWLVTCLQSNFIGTNFRGLFSSPFVSYWAHIDWLAPGYLMGWGILPFWGKPKLRPRPPVMVLTLAASQVCAAYQQSLGQEDLLEKDMATHSCILAWRIPWTEEPGRLQSIGLQRVGHDWRKPSKQTIMYISTHIGPLYVCVLSHFSCVWLFGPYRL